MSGFCSPGLCRSAVRRSAAGTAVVLVFLLVGMAATASALTPIGPKQHFVGRVNTGSTTPPVVKVACPGPVRPGETGPVVGGQTLEVLERATGPGYTGLFSTIYAWVVPPTGTAARPPAQTFADYGKVEPFPAGARGPCGGAGQIEFSSCPYLAPCAAGWVPDYVKVRFLNIAV